MFDFSQFIYDGIMAGIEQGESRFVITERAGAWMLKNVLTSDQMQQISDALDKRDEEADKAAQAEKEAQEAAQAAVE